MNGLDLFTGIGGITLALRDWINPVAYCEIDPYCQSVLLQRMQEGNLPKAPIWDDIRTLCYKEIPDILVDIIFGGFPCQDISVAGNGKGLEGERSGLFFEMLRLVDEIRPRFLFLENVPAITTRGGVRAVKEIASLGFDCRWCVISAASVGALHRRERWFLLAHAKHNGTSANKGRGGSRKGIASGEQHKQAESIREIERTSCLSADVANSMGQGLEGFRNRTKQNEEKFAWTSCNGNDSHPDSLSSIEADKQTVSLSSCGQSWGNNKPEYWPFESRTHWQEIVSTICRVDDGVPHRVDRLKALGNAVVPIQVRKAFRILAGIQ